MSKKKQPPKSTNPDLPRLTAEEAQMLCDAHEIHSMLNNEEEIELLEENNPGLLAAYEKLWAIAGGDDA